MTTLAIVLLAICQSVFLAFSLYLLLLTLAALRFRPRSPGESRPRTRFAIMVPAHNEERHLSPLLESLRETGYPGDMFRIYVVADNCSDGTAGVARRLAAEAFERHDSSNLGKGYALHWLLERVQGTGKEYDAYIFIDADCRVSPNFLHAMDRHFQEGARVVQGYYTVADPFQSHVSALRFIALVLKHYVRPLGRSRLKLSCGLFGTGMGISSEVLSAGGWRAFTLAEDVEYYLQLALRGVSVAFAPEAVVSSQMPTTLKDSRSQNLRWEKGRVQMLCKYGPRLFWTGVLHRSFRRVDAVIEQAIPPLSVTVAAVLGLLLVAWFSGKAWLIGLSLATVTAYWGHVFIGLALARTPLRAYWALIHVPKYVLWKLVVYGQALLPGKRQWVRTRR